MIKSVLKKNQRLKFAIITVKKKKAHKNDEVVKQLQGGIEKYSCNQCEKKFGRETLLKSHMKHIHSDVKPFACSVW